MVEDGDEAEAHLVEQEEAAEVPNDTKIFGFAERGRKKLNRLCMRELVQESVQILFDFIENCVENSTL